MTLPTLAAKNGAGSDVTLYTLNSGRQAATDSASVVLSTEDLAAHQDVQGTKAAGTAAVKSVLTGGVFNTSLPTLTNGQQAAVQFDSSGRLYVNVGNTSLAITAAALPLPTGAATETTLAALLAQAVSSTPTSTLPVLTAAANGLTVSRVVASATSNTATSLKASAGNVGEIDVFNVAAYDVFLKFYNKASAPTVGTDTPVWTIPLKAGTGYSKSFTRGRSFATGIAYAISKLQADSDTTALVAGDVTGTIGWI